MRFKLSWKSDQTEGKNLVEALQFRLCVSCTELWDSFVPTATRVCAATKFPIVTNLWEKPDAEGSLAAMLFAVVHWNKKEERWK